MSKAQVRALRSVDLGFADPGKTLRFFTEVWNLTAVDGNAGVQYLRGTGAFHHIVTLRRTAKPAMIRMVLDAADRAAVDALHAQVVAHGLKTIDPPATLKQPHGTYGFGFKDPEGRNIAIVCGVADHANTADLSDRPRKLSHVNINAGDSDATLACYRDALGFTLTDTTRRLRFLSYNADHHSVVLGFTGGPTINHIAFEMPDLESVMRGAGRMRDNGRGIEWGPGRHGPGNNVFCYFLGPEDVPIELTAEMQQIDASHRAKTPEQWKWPPGRLDHWGVNAGPSERMEAAGLRYNFTEDGWRLGEWR
ncbi:MAG TPA: VOC family protein [Pseudolabrys sp.]|nr:VOC family protein [Pseudolabrys sp.]